MLNSMAASPARCEGATMSRSPFGWSLPPGAASDPNAPWNQEDGPCAVCCKHIDDCCCPECPTCQQQGEPSCYMKCFDEKGNACEPHIAKLSHAQILAREECRIALRQDQVQERKLGLEYLREHDADWNTLCDDSPELSSDLAVNPDPFS